MYAIIAFSVATHERVERVLFKRRNLPVGEDEVFGHRHAAPRPFSDKGKAPRPLSVVPP